MRVVLPGSEARPVLDLVVSCDESLRPIPGAEISVFFVDSGGSGRGVSRTTDEEGAARIVLDGPGEYSLKVSAEGRLTEFEARRFFSEGAQTVDVRLKEPGALRLTVTNRAGQPQPWLVVRGQDEWGDPVEFVTKTEGGGENIAEFGFTDARGILDATSMPPGPLDLEIVSPADEQVVGRIELRVVRGERVQKTVVLE